MKEPQIRSVCVFCGSSSGFDPVHEQAANRLGELLAESGITLVFGGGNAGLMGAIANTVLARGGEVTGIIPDYLLEREHGHRGLTRLEVVGSMHERKALMFELSDGFVSLPGGVGTLEETFEVITWKQLGMHAKPIVVVDIAGYWQGLDALIGATVDHGFAPPPTRELYTMVPGPEDALDALRREAVVAPEADPERL